MLEIVNQLDGFDARGNIKVLMATNRPDTLDPALLRPGRLDRKVEFALPDLESRTQIFNIHTKCARRQAIACCYMPVNLVFLKLCSVAPCCGMDLSYKGCRQTYVLLCLHSNALLCAHLHAVRSTFHRVLCRAMNCERDIRFELLARNCPNATGADLHSVCTEAGMYAIRARRKTVTEKDFLDAVQKVIKGYQKFSATPKYMVYN